MDICGAQKPETFSCGSFCVQLLVELNEKLVDGLDKLNR